MEKMVGVLAVQGAFIEHRKRLDAFGCQTVEIRKPEDLRRPIDGLVLPGGESTAQSKLLHDLGMLDLILAMLEEGLPVFGTCAGLILLACKTADPFPYRRFATLPVSVKRNAYGRQLGSFHADGKPGCRLSGGCDEPVPMTFIRAPKIVDMDEDVEVLVWNGDVPAAVQWKNQIGCAFHPELDSDLRLYRHFLEL